MSREITARFGIGPMSTETIEAVYRYSSFNRKQVMLIASKNQIDYSGGYVNNWSTKEFTDHLDSMKEKYNFSDVVICRDHCGPGFNGGYDLRDTFSLRQIAYLIERTNTFVAIDSVVAHLSLHSNKKGIVVWGSSNVNTHGHEHNINLEAIRHCGKPHCIDLGGFLVKDDTNQNCCLLPENAKPDCWPLLDEVLHEIQTLIK